MKKKLIEVALPLEAINKASAREKSIRHGHPSTLHLWWARRPLAAARAVIFAQMVDDPSSCPDLFPTEKAQEKERQRLFRIIEDLVLWENTTNEKVLQQARDEIWQSWRRACAENADHPHAKELFDRHKLPAFHDPFAGGGSLPLEAQRLGLEAHASDLNPVAVLINKAMIEIPPKFAGRPPVNPQSREQMTTAHKVWRGAQGLAEDVRYYGQWMRDKAEKRIGHLYPKVEVTAEMAKGRPDLKPLVGQKLTVIAWLWARTVKSPNPAFAQVDVPLASTFMLSTKAGKEAYVEAVVEDGGYRFTMKVGKPEDAEAAKNGTKLSRGANFQCLMSGTPIPGDYIKAQSKAGRMAARMMAIVAEGERGQVYLPPTEAMEAVARQAKPEWKPDVEFFQQALGFRVGNYGMTKWSDLFTPRQLVALTTFSDLVREAREQVKRDALAAGLPDDGKALDKAGTGATAYADAVGVYLAFSGSRMADRHSSLCRWDPNPSGYAAKIANTFGRQALPMVWD
jgi:putative DNA methylase